MTIPPLNLNLAMGPTVSGAPVYAPFSVGRGSGSNASSGLTQNVLLMGVLGLAVYWLIKK
jgi:hypothetical protein